MHSVRLGMEIFCSTLTPAVTSTSGGPNACGLMVHGSLTLPMTSSLFSTDPSVSRLGVTPMTSCPSSRIVNTRRWKSGITSRNALILDPRLIAQRSLPESYLFGSRLNQPASLNCGVSFCGTTLTCSLTHVIQQSRTQRSSSLDMTKVSFPSF